MPTSGVSLFNLDLNNLIEEAFERCGSELRSGYDLRTARRSLNLLTIEWANRGINLWTMEQSSFILVTGQAIYPIPVDTIQILDTVIRQNAGTTNQVDINISNIAEPTYASIPTKLAQGRPIQYWFNRQSGNENPSEVTLQQHIIETDTTITVSDVTYLASAGFVKIGNETISYPNINTATNQLINCARGQNGTTAAVHALGAPLIVQNLPCVNIWPTPNSPGNQYTFVYYRLRRMQDAGNGTTIQDIPFRMVPCMVSGIAYYLGMKLQTVDSQRRAELKMDYEEQWLMASSEDRETAPLRIVPRNLYYSGQIMPNKFSSAKYSIAECDRCAQRFKLKELRTQTVKTKPFKIKVCKSCWDPDQPQLQLGMYPVNDPQAVRDPRPDVSFQVSGTSGLQELATNSTTALGFGFPLEGSRVIQWGWAPVGGARADDAGLTPNTLVAKTFVGNVTISINQEN